MHGFLKTGIAALASAILLTGAAAAEWAPPGPIKLMIAFRVGGGADTQARLIAEALEAELGWKFIPEQVTGKGGINMAAALKDQPNDGTVIGMGVTETFGYNMAASPNSGMKPSDFTGLTTTAGFQMGVVARSSKGWSSFADVTRQPKIAVRRDEPQIGGSRLSARKSAGCRFQRRFGQGRQSGHGRGQCRRSRLGFHGGNTAERRHGG